MTDYYVHLGYDWNRYKIGSVWGTSTSNDFDLQCALTTNSDPPWKAALFQFQNKDVLHFQIWDLTKNPQYDAIPAVVGKIGINSLDGKVFDQDRASHVVTLGNGLSWGTFENDTKKTLNPCIEFHPVPGTPHPQLKSPWGSAYLEFSPVGPLTLLDPGRHSVPIEMSFFLEVTVGGERHVFVEDPETIIGSGSQW